MVHIFGDSNPHIYRTALDNVPRAHHQVHLARTAMPPAPSKTAAYDFN